MWTTKSAPTLRRPSSSHRHAAPATGRLLSGRSTVDRNRPLLRDTALFGVGHPTSARWAVRCRRPGAAGMHDRSPKPLEQPPPHSPHDDTGPRG
ncbi:leucine zipper domain-containing protein [Streptomyces sp. NPDC006668]|uniref:leucine zipper domain-containing protein n=1 Tax=Streptomyces sp. NPDC006668 TaxID=3156903 RepID=UPI0033D2BDB3